MAELTPPTESKPTMISGCCSTEQQAACCEPQDKERCCTEQSSSCACAAGQTADFQKIRQVVREP